MDESERFSIRHDEIADINELSTKDDVENISVESQQSGFTKFEQENSDITMDNSNENETFSVSQGSRFIIMQQGNPLDAGPSGFHADVLANDSADKENANGLWMSTTRVSKPLQDSENALCDSSVEKSNIPDHTEMLTSPYYDENEFQRDTFFPSSLNDVSNKDSNSDNDPFIAATFEGSEEENLHLAEIPTTRSRAEDYDLSNVEIDDDLPFILLNSEKSQNQILTGIASPRRSELLNTSVSVNSTEDVAGPSSMNEPGPSYLEDRRFVCTVCGKAFGRKSNFDVHCRIHTGEKPFACSTCGRSFSQNCHLNTHLRTHTGEKPFPCDTCERSFSRKYDLKRHSLTHTVDKPFSCDICGKLFSLKNYLNVHLRIHTGKKQFLCDRCGKLFSSKANLNKHLRTHTEDL